MERLSAKEKAVAIRKLLKAKGWGAKEISVRSESFSMGSAVRVEIKSASIPKKEVEEIARSFESIARCEYSGEILSGSNQYVTISYDWSMMNELYPAVEAEIAAIPVGGHKVIKGIQVHRNESNRIELIRLGNEEVPGMCMRDAWNAAEAAGIVVNEAAHWGLWTVGA